MPSKESRPVYWCSTCFASCSHHNPLSKSANSFSCSGADLICAPLAAWTWGRVAAPWARCCTRSGCAPARPGRGATCPMARARTNRPALSSSLAAALNRHENSVSSQHKREHCGGRGERTEVLYRDVMSHILWQRLGARHVRHVQALLPSREGLRQHRRLVGRHERAVRWWLVLLRRWWSPAQHETVSGAARQEGHRYRHTRGDACVRGRRRRRAAAAAAAAARGSGRSRPRACAASSPAHPGRRSRRASPRARPCAACGTRALIPAERAPVPSARAASRWDCPVVGAKAVGSAAEQLEEMGPCTHCPAVHIASCSCFCCR